MALGMAPGGRSGPLRARGRHPSRRAVRSEAARPHWTRRDRVARTLSPLQSFRIATKVQRAGTRRRRPASYRSSRRSGCPRVWPRTRNGEGSDTAEQAAASVRRWRRRPGLSRPARRDAEHQHIPSPRPPLVRFLREADVDSTPGHGLATSPEPRGRPCGRLTDATPDGRGHQRAARSPPTSDDTTDPRTLTIRRKARRRGRVRTMATARARRHGRRHGPTFAKVAAGRTPCPPARADRAPIGMC